MALGLDAVERRMYSFRACAASACASGDMKDTSETLREDATAAGGLVYAGIATTCGACCSGAAKFAAGRVAAGKCRR